jgi:ribosomal protein S9
MFMGNYRKQASAVMHCRQTSHNAVLASDRHFSEYADQDLTNQDLRRPAVISHNIDIEVRLEPLLRGSRTVREGA